MLSASKITKVWRGIEFTVSYLTSLGIRQSIWKLSRTRVNTYGNLTWQKKKKKKKGHVSLITLFWVGWRGNNVITLVCTPTTRATHSSKRYYKTGHPFPHTHTWVRFVSRCWTEQPGTPHRVLSNAWACTLMWARADHPHLITGHKWTSLWCIWYLTGDYMSIYELAR